MESRRKGRRDNFYHRCTGKGKSSSRRMQPWKAIVFSCARCAKYWDEADMSSLLCYRNQWNFLVLYSTELRTPWWAVLCNWIGRGWSAASGGSHSLGMQLPVLIPIWDYLLPSTANYDAGSWSSTKTLRQGLVGTRWLCPLGVFLSKTGSFPQNRDALTSKWLRIQMSWSKSLGSSGDLRITCSVVYWLTNCESPSA